MHMCIYRALSRITAASDISKRANFLKKKECLKFLDIIFKLLKIVLQENELPSIFRERE